jgi:hypothetical protein
MIFQYHSSEIFIHIIKVMFYNPTYFNPEILIIPLEESSPQTKILGFYLKKALSMNRQTPSACSKNLHECCTHQHLYYLLTPYLLPHKHRRNSSRLWTSRWNRYPNGILLCKFDVYWSVHRCDSQWNEEPTSCYLVLFITHMIAQHVSGTSMPIIWSSRLYTTVHHMERLFLGLDGGKVWAGWLCGWAGGYCTAVAVSLDVPCGEQWYIIASSWWWA